MSTTLGAFAVRRRKLILVASGLFVVVSVALGATVFGQPSSGGFADPASESERANPILAEESGTGGDLSNTDSMFAEFELLGCY